MKSLAPMAGLEELGIPYVHVTSTTDGRYFSQIGESAFVETAELLSIKPEECRFYVSGFYWAPSVAALKRAALREMHCDVQSDALPPDALLLAPNCLTFKDIVEHAQLGKSGRFSIHIFHKEGDWNYWLNKSDDPIYHHVYQGKDANGNPVAFVGRCIRVERIEYYFASEDDPMEKAFAICLATDDLYWEIVV